jgi:hypothetical protein
VGQRDWKPIVRRNARAELYNLVHDPNEQNDLVSARPEGVAELKRLLAPLVERDNDALANDLER